MGNKRVLFFVVVMLVASIAAIGGTITLVRAFNGPGSNTPPNGNGAVGVNSAENLSVGTSTPLGNTKFLIVASSSNDNANYSLQILYPNSSPILTVRNDGKIGIGTVSPAYTLDVNGTVNATTLLGSFSGIVSANNITNGVFGSCGSCGGGIYAFPSSLGVATSSNSGLPAALSVYGGGYFSGDVGVGTTAPLTKLDVNGVIGDSGVAIARSASATVSQGQSYYVASGPRINGMYVIYYTAANRVQQVVITASAEQFDSHAQLSILASHSYGSSPSIGNFRIMYSTDGSTVYLALDILDDVNANGTLQVTNYGPYASEVSIGALPTGMNNDTHYGIVMSSSTADVGIGTASPGASLDVAGDIDVQGGSTNTLAYNNKNFGLVAGYASPVAGRLIFGDDTGWKFSIARGTAASPTDLVTVEDNGDVGIGTTSPNELLDIYGSGNVTPVVQTSNGGTASWRYVGGLNGDAWQVGSGAGGSAGFTFYDETAGAIRMLINSSGNVGIGTTAPTDVLTIAGNSGNITLGKNFGGYNGIWLNGQGATADDYNFLSSASDQNLFINRPTGKAINFRENNSTQMVIVSGGDVGIGTTSPAPATLAISGTQALLSIGNSSTPHNYLSGCGSSNNGYIRFALSYGIYWDCSASEYVVTDPTYNQASFADSNGVFVWRMHTGALSSPESASTWQSYGVMSLSSAGTLTVGSSGSGKITVGTVDPVYTIGGAKYATYAPGMTGQKEETAGLADLACSGGVCSKTISFSNLTKGSDLWLFYQATDFGANMEYLDVELTPSFDGRVWYKKDVAANTLTIFGSSAGEVSYRLTANRFDWQEWPNTSTSTAAGLVPPAQ